MSLRFQKEVKMMKCCVYIRVMISVASYGGTDTLHIDSNHYEKNKFIPIQLSRPFLFSLQGAPSEHRDCPRKACKAK